MQVDQKGLHDERAESRESGEMAGGVEVDQPCIEEGEQPIGDRLGNPTLHARQQAGRGVHALPSTKQCDEHTDHRRVDHAVLGLESADQPGLRLGVPTSGHQGGSDLTRSRVFELLEIETREPSLNRDPGTVESALTSDAWNRFDPWGGAFRLKQGTENSVQRIYPWPSADRQCLRTDHQQSRRRATSALLKYRISDRRLLEDEYGGLPGCRVA